MERRLLAVFDTLADHAWIKDLDGRYLAVNSAYAAARGRSRESIVGLTDDDLFPPELAAEFRATDRQVLRTRELLVIDAPFRPDPDGPVTYWETRKAPYRDESGAVIGVLGISRDVTRERAAQRALRERERQLAEAQSITGVGSWEWELETGEARWSDEHYRLWGVAPGAFEPEFERFMESVHPEDRALVRERMERSAAGAEFRPYEYRITRADGAERRMLTRGEVVRDAAGNPLRLVGTVQDVTEQRATEQALRVSEERFRRLVESAPDAIVVHEPDGRFVEVNDAACRLWGYSREELLSMRLGELDATYAQAALDAIWGRLLDGGVAVEQQTRARDGRSVPVEVHLVGFREGEQRLVLAIVRDVTERRQMEEQLRQAARMEAVGRLAGGVAHDFNNMLMVITGFAALLQPEVEHSAEAQEYLEEIRKATRRSTELTQQLLAYGRRQFLRAERIDLAAAVDEAQRLLARVLGADVDVRVEHGPEVPPVLADPGQLQQVLLNLAINARDAMPEGGSLVLRTRGERVDAARPVRGVILPAGRYAVLEVEDTGTGMDEAVLRQIFEPFYTTKETGKGTGLGLAMVHGTVTQSGGHVEVSSTPGRGSRFRIYLPEALPGAVHPPGAASLPEPPPLGQGTVLLVEDEAAVRLLLAHTLRQAGYEVLPAADGEEALGLAARCAAPPDLLLTDLVMPRLSGVELARLLRQRWPQLPIVYMSGYSDEAREPLAAADPDAPFLQKPFSLPALVRTLEERLRASRRGGVRA